MQKIENEFDKFVYEQYCNKRDAKDKEIETKTKELETKTKELETKTKEIETKNRKIETLNKEIESIKKLINKLHAFDDFNSPEARKIINSLMFLI